MYSLRMSFWMRAGNLFPVCALFLRHHQIHGPQHRRGRVDGHRDCGLFEVDAGEENFHVFKRIDRHAALAHFAFAGRVVGVVAHQRGQIECDGKAAAAVLQQIFVALIGFFGRREAGELPHGVELAAISSSVNAAGKWRRAGIPEIFFLAPVLGEIGLRVEAANGDAGNRGEAGVPVLVEIHASGRANRPLGGFFEGGRKRLLRPLLLVSGGMAVLKNIGDRTFGNLRLRRLLLRHEDPSVLL